MQGVQRQHVRQVFRSEVLVLALLTCWVASVTPCYGDWTEQGHLVFGDGSGECVGLSGDYFIAGGDDYTADVYKWNGALWVRDATLTQTDTADRILFGYSVAISEDYAACSAPWWQSESGAVYVFHNDGAAWTQVARLTASDASGDDWFGESVAISGDTIVVGAARDNNPASNLCGSVYVFEQAGGIWTQTKKLEVANAQKLGKCVAIQGDTIVAGAPSTSGVAASSGAVYVFDRQGGDLVLRGSLMPADGVADDRLGQSVAVDGDTLVAASINHYDGQADTYVYERQGDTWIPQAKLTPPDWRGSGNLHRFVSIDGDLIALGAFADDTALVDAGAVYLYAREGNTWNPTSTVIPAGAERNDQFGISVGLDGGRLTVGSSAGSGSVYVFVPEPTTLGLLAAGAGGIALCSRRRLRAGGGVSPRPGRVREDRSQAGQSHGGDGEPVR